MERCHLHTGWGSIHTLFEEAPINLRQIEKPISWVRCVEETVLKGNWWIHRHWRTFSINAEMLDTLLRSTYWLLCCHRCIIENKTDLTLHTENAYIQGDICVTGNVGCKSTIRHQSDSFSRFHCPSSVRLNCHLSSVGVVGTRYPFKSPGWKYCPRRINMSTWS